MQNKPQQKTYVIFLNDESGSMHMLTGAALKDYNANVGGVKDSATKYEQDTIVSMFSFGGGEVRRNIVNSNPHVLKPLTTWRASGGTPGRKAIKEAIDLFKSMPDFNNPNVAFAVFTTTDGAFDGDFYGTGPTVAELAREIEALNRTGRWTFVFRVPNGGSRNLDGLGIPHGNIQEWETTEAGMAESTAKTAKAFDTFFATRATGQTSSTVFYASAAAVDTSALVDITKDVSLYVVDAHQNGMEIRDFILRHRMEYLKGSAFYQLTKTEARVQPEKIIAVRNRTTGKIYAGKEARLMLGLPTDKNVRLHPGDHGNYDLFIQSSSVNRKLVGGTGVIYWKAIGKPFTEADLAYLQPKPAAPAVVQLPAVAPTNKPTPSPLKPTPKAAAAVPAPAHGIAKPQPIIPSDGGRVRYHTPSYNAVFYPNREVARYQADLKGKKQYDAGPTAPKGKRFYVA